MAEGFEKIEFTDMDSSTEDKMTASDYAQVIFHDIAEFYPVDVNVECKYTVTSLLQPSKRDWVGVYKVGWSSSKEHIYYEWAILPCEYQTEKPFEGVIVFKASTLPKDDGEFYQFCYVTSSGHVRGASTPFQFKRPSADEFVEIEDLDDDIMVIKSKTNALEDQLGSVTKEREVLVKNKERLETERESLLSKLVDTERKLKQEKGGQETVKKEVKQCQGKIEQLNTEAKDMLVVHDGLREKIARLSEEKMAMAKLLEEKDSYIRSTQAKIKSLINEKDSIMGKNKMLEEEKDLYKTHFTSSENTLQGHIKEIDNLKKQLESAEEFNRDLHQKLEELSAEIEVVTVQLADQKRANDSDKFRVEELEEILKNSEEKIAALDECKLQLGKDLDTITMTYQEVADKWEQSQEEAHMYKEKVLLLEEVNETQTISMGEQIQELHHKLKLKTQENEQLSEESERIKGRLQEMSLKKREEEEGPLFALRMAQDSLKARLHKSDRDRTDMEKDVAELIRRKNVWESREQEMKREIEDLKERLLMGQEEYKEKYIECKKVYQEFKRLQREAGSRRNSESPEKSGVRESEISTQTRVDTGTKHTETEKKIESEQMTQTAIRVDKESHTQTSAVSGAEQQTQTPKKEGSEQQTQTAAAAAKAAAERQTQTLVKEDAEQQTQTTKDEKTRVTQTEIQTQHMTQSLQDFADLTNPELQMQLDDLGRELENRTAKKQKYKEQYQREKEKCAYLQKHYYEELDKKEAEINVVKKELTEKQNVVNFLEETLEERNREIERLKSSPTQVNETIVYPPQQSHQQLSQLQQHHYNFMVSSPQNACPSPALYPPQTLVYPHQPCPPYPVFYDRQPLLVYGRVAGTLPQGGSQEQQGNTMVKTKDAAPMNVADTPTANASADKEELHEELDPLKVNSPAAMANSQDIVEDIKLPPPLIPEETQACKMTKVLSYVGGQDPFKQNIKRGIFSDIFGESDTCPEPSAPSQSEGIAHIEGVLQEGANQEPGSPETEEKVQFDPLAQLVTDEEQLHTPPPLAEPEDIEEKFFDAPETKQCPVCDMTFPLNTSEDILNVHVEKHFTNTKDCPVCKKKFSSNTDQKIYETHVQKHFDEQEDGMEV